MIEFYDCRTHNAIQRTMWYFKWWFTNAYARRVLGSVLFSDKAKRAHCSDVKERTRGVLMTFIAYLMLPKISELSEGRLVSPWPYATMMFFTSAPLWDESYDNCDCARSSREASRPIELRRTSRSLVILLTSLLGSIATITCTFSRVEWRIDCP
jgi:hypothetical protein